MLYIVMIFSLINSLFIFHQEYIQIILNVILLFGLKIEGLKELIWNNLNIY